MKLSTGDVGVLLCADGMVVMAESEEGLQSSLQALSEAMGRWDLKVNWKKTKVIKVHPLHILNTSHTHSMDTYHTHAPPTPTPPHPPTHTHTHTHKHTHTLHPTHWVWCAMTSRPMEAAQLATELLMRTDASEGQSCK